MASVNSDFSLFVFLSIVFTALIFSIYFIRVWIDSRKQKEIREQITGLANNTLEMTPEEYFDMRNANFGGRGSPKYANNYNFAGVYILHNKSKNLYYIGQRKQVLNRVNNHFNGRGNGDVYADYKYGDRWTIRMIALKSSGFHTLNELERHAIATYDSYNSGYNKTRGNR